MTTKAIEAGARADLLPCPFCGSEIRHIESWAKSFQPNRLYHEWHHVDDDDLCPIRMRSKIVCTLTDDLRASEKYRTAWNRRAAIASGELVPASAVAAERERCAVLIDSKKMYATDVFGDGWNGAIEAAVRSIRALSPEPASGEFVVGWRDISTAPKDMTEVIVLCGRKDVRLGWYFAPSATTFGWRDQHNAPIKPTHWMPRPKWPAMLNPATKDGERQ